MIFILVGCTGSRVSLSEITTFTHNGSSVSIHRSAEAISHSDTTNPPTVELPPLTIEPIILENGALAIKPIEENLDDELVSSIDSTEVSNKPIISWIVRNGGSIAVGSFISMSEAALSLLKWPMIIGAILLVGGVAAFVWLPMKKMGIAIAIAGGSLMAFSFLLAQYSLYIMIAGSVVLVCAMGYLFWHFRIQQKAAEELVVDIQHNKKQGDRFRQSQPTKDLVRKIKDKNGFH